MLEWLPLGLVLALYGLHRSGALAIDYPLRQAIRWRRGAPPLPAEPKADLFPPEASPEVRRLVTAYGLEAWERDARRIDFGASLFYLQMLERALRESGTRLPDPVRALDAGPSDWFYVRALHALLARWEADPPRAVALDGVELDAWRVYRDGYSRHDWATAYIAGLPGVRYIAGDVRDYREAVDVAFMLYPFLFAADHRRWGLPSRHLRPAELLAHVAARLPAGGRIVIANQGQAERQEMHRLLGEAGLPIVWWSEHRSPLWDFDPVRFVTVAEVAPSRS